MTPLRTKEFDEQFNPARVWQFSAFDADASNLNDGEFGLYNGANNNSGAHLSNVDTLYVPNFAATYGDDATDNSTVLNTQDLRAFFTNALDKKGYVFVELKRNGAANTAYVLAKSIAAHGAAGWRLSGLTWVDAFVPGSSGLGWDLAVSLTSESMLGALADSDVVTSNLVAVHNQTELDAVSTKPVFNAVLVLQAFSTYQVGDLLIYDKKAPGWKVEIEGRRFVQGGALALPSYDRLATNQAGRFNFTGSNNRLTVNPADVYDELILKREVYAKRRLRFGDSGAVIEFTGSFTDIQNDVFFAPFTLISGTLPASGTFTLNLLDDLSRVSALRTGEIDPNETLSNLEAVSSKAVGESLERYSRAGMRFTPRLLSTTTTGQRRLAAIRVCFTRIAARLSGLGFTSATPRGRTSLRPWELLWRRWILCQAALDIAFVRPRGTIRYLSAWAIAGRA